MSIKCPAGPQKAMYLSCDHWRRQGVLGKTQVEFNSASAVLFSVPEFVPPLMQYVNRYKVRRALTTNLKAIDDPARKAWFQVKHDDGSVETVEKTFNMIHVVPPQSAPD